jgi:hypothetical protein
VHEGYKVQTSENKMVEVFPLLERLLSKNLKINIYRTIILPVVLYGCEAWSLTLREERKLRVFENRVLRRVFGPKREGDHWGDPDVDGRIILRWIFRKWEGVVGTGWSGLRIGTSGGHL